MNQAYLFVAMMLFVPLTGCVVDLPEEEIIEITTEETGNDSTPPDPNTDSDGDGIRDSSDNCPDTPSNEVVNIRGCSASQLETDDGTNNTENEEDNTIEC